MPQKQASEYAEKLKDPRWQKKRLEIFERDEWACQICYNTDKTLTVHHKLYLPDKDPWDYPNDHLTTLCQGCHDDERTQRPDMESDLINMLRLQFDYLNLYSLCNGLSSLEIPTNKRNSYLYTLKGLVKEEEDLIAFINRPKEVISGKSST